VACAEKKLCPKPRLANGLTSAHLHAEDEKLGKALCLQKPFCHGITAFTLSPEFGPAAARKTNFSAEPSSATHASGQMRKSRIDSRSD
jgi:hypothetical protein